MLENASEDDGREFANEMQQLLGGFLDLNGNEWFIESKCGGVAGIWWIFNELEIFNELWGIIWSIYDCSDIYDNFIDQILLNFNIFWFKCNI